MLGRLRIILEMIKFEHTLFALPFALLATFVAMAGLGRVEWVKLGWILLAMVGARSSAMAFNRITDLEFDRRNPRTQTRALPAGLITVSQAWLFTLATAALLVIAAWQLNPLALWLSPVALLVVWAYSLTKRFTAASHLVLGLALGIAPSAAWIALLGRLDVPPMVLSAAVLCWVAGFDIIYASQDIDFDRAVGLHSIPAKLGLPRALTLSSVLHVFAFAGLAAFGWLAGLGWGYGAALLPVAVLLITQHRMVRPDDLSRVNAAFFTANGAISLALLLGAGVDLLLNIYR
jgi:4-hydroxybenzoate polyprenyltransferase